MARKGTKIEPRSVIVDTRKGGVEIDFTEGSPLDKEMIGLWDILLIGAIEMQTKTKPGAQRTLQWLGREFLAHGLGMKETDIKSWAVRFGAASEEKSSKRAPAKKAGRKAAPKKAAKKATRKAAPKKAAKKAAPKKAAPKKATKKAAPKKATKKAPARKPAAKKAARKPAKRK